jgi:uncharacterized protein YbjQ (UPF0145 family)
MKVPMKAAGFAALFVSLSLCVASVQARNVAVFLPIQDAIKEDKANSRLSGIVDFYFGTQPYPAVETTLSQGVVAYKKGSVVVNQGVDIYMRGSIVRTEEESCHRTFLAALAELQEKARRMGGDAVINIESYYKKISFKSSDKYECRAGTAKTGVMLRGDIVRLKR